MKSPEDAEAVTRGYAWVDYTLVISSIYRL